MRRAKGYWWGSNSLSADGSKGHASDIARIFGRTRRHPCAFVATRIPGSLLGGPTYVLQHEYHIPPHGAWSRAPQPCSGANIVDMAPQKTFGTTYGLPITSIVQPSALCLPLSHLLVIDLRPKSLWSDSSNMAQTLSPPKHLSLHQYLALPPPLLWLAGVPPWLAMMPM